MKKTFKKVSGCLLTSALLASGIVSSIALLPSETVHATTNSQASEPVYENLALNAAIPKFSAEHGNFPVRNLTDNSKTSRWSTEQTPSSTSPGWVVIDLGAPKTFNTFEITWENNDNNAKTYNIYVSDTLNETGDSHTDNTNWGVPVVTVSNRAKSHVSKHTFAQKTGRYIKLAVYAHYGWPNTSACDFTVMNVVESRTGRNHVLGTNGTVMSSSTCNPSNAVASFANDGLASKNANELGQFRNKRWSSQDVNNSNRNAIHITATFPVPTLVSEVYVDFWRDCDPMPSLVKSFDIVYTDANGSEHRKTINCKNVGGDNYADKVTAVFKEPVVMKTMKLTNFVLSSNTYPNVCVEEIEAYSNVRNDEYNKLSTLIAEAKALQGKCTDDSWNTLNSVITSAETVLATDCQSNHVLAEKIQELRIAFNKVNRIYTVTIQKNGEELTGASFNGVYNTVNTTEIIAPETIGDQAFVGWYKVENGQPAYLVTTNKTLKVAASNDVTYNAVYGTAPEVDKTTKLLMQNAFVSYNPTTQKYDAKFVGKVLNLPEGATITEAGLKWKVGEHTELGADAFVAKLPSSVNTHGQYSMTITGMPAGVKVSGQLFVTYTLNGETHTITSEGVKVLES